jgi:hypothetical protein
MILVDKTFEKTTVKRVNAKGIAALRAWIKDIRDVDDGGPVAYIDLRTLEIWAQEAEQSMANGNPPMVEMPATHSRTGRPETFTLPADCVEEVEVCC